MNHHVVIDSHCQAERGLLSRGALTLRSCLFELPIGMSQRDIR